MIGKTAILVTTHNRKALVARALPSLVTACNRAVKAGVLGSADIWIYDDGSDEYEAEWLQSLAPDARVVCLPKQDPNPHRSVAKLRSRAFQAALDFADYDYFLHTDSDMLYDPDAFGQISRLMVACPDWGVIGLFNPSLWDWEQRSSEAGDAWYTYTFCGGTMWMRRPEPDKLGLVSVPRTQTWDGYYARVFGGSRACISRTSYVEHLGGGIHRPNPARNPSEWLQIISRHGATRASSQADRAEESARHLPTGSCA